MIRVLVLLGLIAALAVGGQLLLAHPGSVSFTWLGYSVQTSMLIGVVAVLAAALAISLLWGLARFLLRLPRVMSHASRRRKRDRGYEALSRGLIAIGAGDARAARREASEAGRLIRHEPMTLLLRAQAAQLSGDRATARALFEEMSQKPATRLLGLRGLYLESRRAGEHDAAFAYAEEAQKLMPVAWAGQALIERRAADGDWAAALDALERSAAAGQIEKDELAKGRAALKLATARDLAEREPETARALAQDALSADPGLAPAAALAAKLLGRRGDFRKAGKIVEQAWEREPHPELTQAYVDLRSGDSSMDRLARARKLLKLRPNDPEGRLAVAAVAIAAREFVEARAALAPLVEGDAAATARVCAAMAHLEEAEGHDAKAREWWGRAARAPRDKAWVADGLISESWEPVTPSGELGGYVWRTPDERLAPPIDLPASIFEPAPVAMVAAPTAEPAPAPATIAAPVPAPAPPPPAVPAVAATAAAQPIRLHDRAAPEPAAAPSRKPESSASRPEPVVFPLPKAPDDPGVGA
jgi:HemY protein